jgi:flagellar biosynthesis protein FlhF
VGFELAHRTAALCESLQAHSHCDVILIDTPGFDFRHQDLMREIAKALAADPKIETHLVLPASVRATSLRKLALAYEPFQPSKTIFTKLDEADTYGALVNYAFWSRRPVSFLTDGQSIPEDLRMATPAEIADLVLGREPEARAAAA